MILLRSFQTGGAVALAPTKPAPAAKPRTFEELSALTPKEFASLPAQDIYNVRLQHYKNWASGYRNPSEYSHKLTPQELEAWKTNNQPGLVYTGNPTAIWVAKNSDGSLNYDKYFPQYERPVLSNIKTTPAPAAAPPVNTTSSVGEAVYLHPNTGQPLDPNIYGRPEGAQVNVQLGQYLDMVALKNKHQKASPTFNSGGLLKFQSGGTVGPRYFTYNDTRYKKEGGKWYKEMNNKFVPLTKGDVAARSKVLDKHAVPLRHSDTKFPGGSIGVTRTGDGKLKEFSSFHGSVNSDFMSAENHGVNGNNLTMSSHYIDENGNVVDDKRAEIDTAGYSTGKKDFTMEVTDWKKKYGQPGHTRLVHMSRGELNNYIQNRNNFVPTYTTSSISAPIMFRKGGLLYRL